MVIRAAGKALIVGASRQTELLRTATGSFERTTVLASLKNVSRALAARRAQQPYLRPTP